MAETKTINAGPVGIKPKGAYDAATPYTLLDCVLYNHDSWVCTAINQDGSAGTVTGQTPQDGSQYWKALTDGGRAAVAVGAQMRSEFDTWFGASANAGIRKTVADWLASVQQAWTQWFSDTLATGVRKIWNDWFSARQSDWSTLADNATTATNRANNAAAHSEELNDHPAYIADSTAEKPGDLNFWYIWNHESQEYVKDAYSKGDNLQYDDMSQQEKDDLIDAIKEDIVFASTQTCEDIVSELS